MKKELLAANIDNLIVAGVGEVGDVINMIRNRKDNLNEQQRHKAKAILNLAYAHLDEAISVSTEIPQ